MGKGLDPATVRDIKTLVKSWKTTQRLATDLSRTPQMPHSSITGSIPVYDDEGNVAARLGKQDDGSYAPTVTLGPVPPRPVPATVSDKNVGQAAITWDGHYVDDVPAPLDFARVEAHITRDPDAELDLDQSSTTRWASIVDPAGGTATVKLDDGTWFVRLVTRSQADRVSEPSEPVELEVSSVLDRDDIIDVIEQAGTGNRVYYATTEPSQDGVADGDTWRQREPHPGTNIIAEWRWESGAWVGQQITSEVITNLDAGKITAGMIQAAVGIGTTGSIIAGDPVGVNASMTSDGFRAHAITEEGDQYASIRLGTGSDESVEIIAEPGEPPVASISPEGDVSAASLTSGSDVTISGTPFLGQMLTTGGPLGWLDLMPRGLTRMAAMAASAVGTWPNNVNSAMGWFTFQAYAGRVYSFEMPWDGTLGIVGSPSAVRMTARVYQSVASGPGQQAPEPTLVNENLMTEWSQYQPTVGSAVSDVLSFTWQPWASEQIEPEPREVALLVSVFPNGATFTSNTSRQATWRATVRDIGPADASKLVVGSAPGAAAERRYVTTWVASNTMAYDQTGARIGGPNITTLMRQGTHASGGWSGQSHSAIIFNDPSPTGWDNTAIGEPSKYMSTALTGAQVSRVEIYVYNTSWRAKRDNRLYVQQWTGGNTIPATHTSSPNTSTGGRYIFPYPGAGVGQWMTVPSSWIGPLTRGIQIGPLDPLAGTVLGTSGNFAGASFGETQTYRPKVRVTYTR